MEILACLLERVTHAALGNSIFWRSLWELDAITILRQTLMKTLDTSRLAVFLLVNMTYIQQTKYSLSYLSCLAMMFPTKMKRRILSMRFTLDPPFNGDTLARLRNLTK